MLCRSTPSSVPTHSPLGLWALVACMLVGLVHTMGCNGSLDVRSDSELQANDLVAKGDRALEADSLRAGLMWYHRAIEADSSYVLAQLLAAQTHAGLDEFEQAIPHIDQLIRLRPAFAGGYRSKSVYLRELGQLEASRQAAHIAIGLEPEQASGYSLLGATYLQEGLPGTARAYFLEAVARIEDESAFREQLLAGIDSVAAKAPDDMSIDVPQMVADLEAAWAEQVAREVSAPGEPTRPRSRQSLLALLATWLTVVGGILTLFQQTEDTVTKPQRDRIRGWLLQHREGTGATLSGSEPMDDSTEDGSSEDRPVGAAAEEEEAAEDEAAEGEAGKETADAPATRRPVTRSTEPVGALDRSDWSSTFVELFESVFGRAHWSWRCLSRSAVATVATLGVILVVTSGAQGVPGNLRYGGGLTNLAALLGVMFVSNFVADYFSLYETRWVLGRLAGTPKAMGKAGFLGLDLVLTSLIVVATTAAMLLLLAGIGQLIPLPTMLEPTLNNLLSWSTSLGDGRRLILGGTSIEIFPALAMLGSTYFTSIWVVLYVGAGVALRLTRRAFDGVTGLSQVLDIDQRPLQAMGIALSVVVTALFGLGQWLL